jgi:predicted O-methyltransferase YrrM
MAIIDFMLGAPEHSEIERLWTRKLQQDANGLPQAQRHRNLEPPSAEFLCALASGIGAKQLVEIGGSSGISTIALAAAARATGGRLISFEIEPARQREAQETIARLGLSQNVQFHLQDAAAALSSLNPLDFALIDCEKEDYVRFFDLLPLKPGALVVADNVISHNLNDYIRHVRSKPGLESITLPIGKGLEVTKKRCQTTFPQSSSHQRP